MTPSLAPSTATVGISPPGFRLPGTTRLGRVRLQVADLRRSIAFYGDILGFHVIDRHSGTARLGATGSDAVLVELVERPGVRPVARRGLLGLFHTAFLLPERPDLARFVTHLAESGQRAGMSDHLVSEAIYLNDPDGLGIEVYADRPRTAWRHEGRQIAMATNPLDVRKLLIEGGDTRWEGAPERTVVGHVHLHVGDLDSAAAFYHEALGLDKIVWDYPGALFLSAGGYHHHLGVNTWAGDAPSAGEGDARLLEWTVVVPGEEDVEAAARSLTMAGNAVLREDGAVVAADPWGTRLRLAIAD